MLSFPSPQVSHWPHRRKIYKLFFWSLDSLLQFYYSCVFLFYQRFRQRTSASSRLSLFCLISLKSLQTRQPKESSGPRLSKMCTWPHSSKARWVLSVSRTVGKVPGDDPIVFCLDGLKLIDYAIFEYQIWKKKEKKCHGVDKNWLEYLCFGFFFGNLSDWNFLCYFHVDEFFFLFCESSHFTSNFKQSFIIKIVIQKF